MKQLKKTQSGMTLVEVVVAMAIFSSMTLGITMTLAAAVKYNARNIRRDYELNTQQAALEKKTAGGVAIYDSSFQARTLQYVDDSGNVLTEIDNVTEYKALKTAQGSEDFNFEVKTFTSVPLGSTKVTHDKSLDTYKITFSNLSDKKADVYFVTETGTIYEGDPSTGYRHTSPLYKRTVDAVGGTDDEITDADGQQQAPSGFEIGYENTALDTTSMAIRVYADGALIYSSHVNPYNLRSSPTGVLNLTVNGAGTSVTGTYE